MERGVKPRRIDWVTRVGMTLLSRFFNWRDALVFVRTETLFAGTERMEIALAAEVAPRPSVDSP